MNFANIKPIKLNSFEKPYAKQTISVIVPLVGKAAYVNELLKYVEENCKGDYLQEIIFINTTQCEQVHNLKGKKIVRVLDFAGASFSKCLEIGAFEATGDVLFFLKPDTFPALNFGNIISASLRKKIKAGIIEKVASKGISQWLKYFLPLRCVLCFKKADNFFITRQLFYIKTKYVPRKEIRSFATLIEVYALVFKARLI